MECRKNTLLLKGDEKYKACEHTATTAEIQMECRKNTLISNYYDKYKGKFNVVIVFWKALHVMQAHCSADISHFCLNTFFVMF